MAKATGAEIWDFWQNGWPGDNWFIDDYEVDVEGADGCLLEMGKKYDLVDLGTIYWQGDGDPPDEAPHYGRDGLEVSKWYAWWKRKQTTTTFSVTIPKTQEGEFKKVCKAYAWRVT
jgi:hypothetical protein